MNCALEIGQTVALTLAEGAAPSRCYIGNIVAIDEKGVRITLADFISGSFSGYDVFAPWEQITSALVCTKAHSLDNFIALENHGGRWQQAMKGSVTNGEDE